MCLCKYLTMWLHLQPESLWISLTHFNNKNNILQFFSVKLECFPTWSSGLNCRQLLSRPCVVVPVGVLCITLQVSLDYPHASYYFTTLSLTCFTPCICNLEAKISENATCNWTWCCREASPQFSTRQDILFTENIVMSFKYDESKEYTTYTLQPEWSSDFYFS